MQQRQTIAICHPRMERGGSEALVMWGIAALKDTYRTTLVTTNEVDLGSLNRFYGTSLAPGEFDVLRAPLPFYLRGTGRAAALRGAYYQRFCQRIAREYDVMVSAYGALDFGVPAIQWVADFSFDRVLWRRGIPPRGVGRLLYGENPLRRAYLWLCRRVGSPSGRDVWREGLILANSRWTAGVLRERYGAQAEVLYPPVANGFPHIPFGEKEPGFVVIGRIAPEKRIEEIVDVLGRVRALGHDVHLHLVGPIGEDGYGRLIQRLCHQHRGWIRAEGQKHGEEKKRMLATHRFSMNACPREAFGISVAEAVKAGSIVFVPSEGGQAEIVAHPMLTFDGPEDAVVKIDTVLRQQELQQKLCQHLAERGKAFSIAHFMTGIRQAVSRFLREKEAGGRSSA